MDLAYFFQAVVRPILEYACPAWHTSLTKEQSKKLEDIQSRALQIIVGNVPYEEACYMLDFPSLAEIRLDMCETLFKQIACESHVLHYLLPAKRDAELTCHMRSMNKYPTVRARTNCYKNSFVLYALSHFQWHLYVWLYVCMHVSLVMFVLCMLIQPLAAKF